MALGRKKADEQHAGGGVAVAEPEVGMAAEQCAAAGQALTQAGYLDAEKLATLLQEANGDLIDFSNFALTRHGVGRNELANAVAAACQVPFGDPSIGDQLALHVTRASVTS